MDNRTRIINTVLCREVDRLPFFFYFGPWSETIERWKTEGMEGENWHKYFDFDPGILSINVNLGYSPNFEYKKIEDKGDSIIIQDQLGIIQQILKEGASIPNYISYPVKERKDWERLKHDRLDPNDPNRFPVNWNSYVKLYNEGNHAVQIGAYPYGLFGTVRDMMGVERLLISFYDEPDLIHDIMDYLTDFWITIYEKICHDVKVDAIHMWEDMSGKNGSLISPTMVKEFMVPNYKKIKAFADTHHIPIFSLDTDGDCSELIPLFLESGINLIFPFEV
ncbi:MAG: uroporphyrinogen decarboxylase family protein, partial [Caldicoprobacterales bacterium]